MDTALALTLIAARTDTLRQRIILDLRGNGQENEDFMRAAHGREIKFYTFTGRDSVQYPTWPCKFLTLSGGETHLNENSPTEKDDYLETALEQRYSAPLAPNTVIAEGITFNWDSAHTVRMPDVSVRFADSVMQTDEFLGGATTHLFPYTRNYVVVTGHLFDDGTALDTAKILKIEVLDLPR